MLASGDAWTNRLRNRRGLSILLPIAGLLVIGLLVFRSSAGHQTPLVTCTAKEFATIRQQLASQGLRGATFRDGTVYVPAETADDYRQAMASVDGRPSMNGERRWADVWQSASDRLGQFSGHREREAAKEMARAQTLGRLLSELPDVADADVVWDESPATGWREPPRVRATVYLKARENSTIGPHVIDAVRRAVAGSKANLAAADVVVMDQSTGRTYDGETLDPRETRMARLSTDYRREIESALNYLPGVRVHVTVSESSFLSPTVTASMPGDLPFGREALSIAVAIPEAAIRALSGTNETPIDGGTTRRREVFRSVEQHVHSLVREKLTAMFPALLSAQNGHRILIETIPSPAATPTETAASTPFSLEELGESLANQPMLLIALVTGLAALSMLVSMLRRNSHWESSVESVPKAVAVPEWAAEPSSTPEPAVTNAVTATESPATAVETRTMDYLSRLAEALKQETNSPPVASQPEASPASPPRQSTKVYSGRHNPAQRDLLNSVLTRLEASQGTDPIVPRLDEETAFESPTNDSFPTADIETPTEVSPPSRISAHDNSRTMESLIHVEGHLLREIARSVDAATWSRALFGTSTKLQSRILPQLPPEESSRVGAELQARRPIRLREIDEAQAEVLHVWREIEQSSGPGFVAGTASSHVPAGFAARRPQTPVAN